MPPSPDTLATKLHQLYGAGEMFPAELGKGLTLDAAYQTQFSLLRLREGDNEHLVGWKVGLTSKAMQEQQGVHEPCFGHLLASGHRRSNVRFEFDELLSPGIENELCIQVGKRLQGKNLSFEEAVAGIEAVAPALEVVEKRCVFGASLSLAIAGNAQQHTYVTGPFTPFDAGLDLSETQVSVEINGKFAERATGAEVLGNPVNSLIWLAGFLSEYDAAIEPGMCVMSGSFTKQYTVSKNDRIRSDFAKFGEVSAEFL